MTLPLLLAHGIGGRADLPVPVGLAQYGAGAILLVTFAFLAFLWKSPRFENGAGAGIAVPRLQRIVDSPAMNVVLRVVGVVALMATVAIALFGSDSASQNVTPTWLYVWLWVGLVPVSIVCGAIWRRIDPLATITAGLRRVLDGPNDDGTTDLYPARLGTWPAVAGLAMFAWLELVAPERDVPSTVAVFVISYCIVHILLGCVYGPTWHTKADAFSVYSDYFARLSPWMRRADGTLVLTNPFRNLAGLPAGPGSFAVVATLLGATAFDGFTRSELWNQWSGNQSDVGRVILGTVALAAAIAAVAITFRVAIAVTSDDKVVSGRFTHALVPIAAGYFVAHYFSLLLFQGQAGVLLLADPFDQGWNLLGMAGDRIDYTWVSAAVISTVQVVAIVIGHVLGVVAAHDRNAAIFEPRDQMRSQLPLIAVMVLYTFGGIGLLLSA